MTGGYCALSGCAGGANPCPAGSACFTFNDGADSYCIQTCAASSECRTTEGYVCDSDSTCWPGTTTTPTGTSPIGGPCAADSDCKDAGATCYPEQGASGPTGFIKGYCMLGGCTAGACPAGSTCLTVTSGGDMACFASCAGGAPCPQVPGYACSSASETCWPGCSGDGDCPSGYGCKPDDGFCVLGWTNAPFACDDQSYEPNDNLGAAALVAGPLADSGVDLCTGDLDWLRVDAPAGTLVTLGATFPHVMGDLDLLAYDEGGAFLGARLGYESYGANLRKYENDVEFLSVLNTAGPTRGYFKVQGFSGATNTYELQVRETDWVDDLDCGDHFAFNECRGYDGTVKGKLYNFPFARPDDPYVPGGYTLESYGNYRWLRRELIMLVRYAIHQTQQKFPGTDPIGLIDMCQIDGITPGFDIGDPRHPESTHDQGGNMDIAYYQTDGDSSGDVVCGPNGSDHDGYFCTSVANTVLDTERQAYFMAMINQHPRLRVIGIDKLLAPLVIAELAVQRDKGWISAALHDKTVATMAYGDGWPFHHHHIHVSMRWWSQDAMMNNGLLLPLPEPPVGCGYRMAGDGPLP
jgi:hypothetical protein